MQLGLTQKAKQSQAEPSQAAPNPSHAEEQNPFRPGSAVFFFDAVWRPNQAKPNPSRAAPKKKRAFPSWLSSFLFFFGAAWRAKLREPSHAKPKPSRTEEKTKPSALARQFGFSSVRFGSPNQAEPSQAKPNQSRAAPKKNINPSAALVAPTCVTEHTGLSRSCAPTLNPKP